MPKEFERYYEKEDILLLQKIIYGLKKAEIAYW